MRRKGGGPMIALSDRARPTRGRGKNLSTVWFQRNASGRGKAIYPGWQCTHRQGMTRSKESRNCQQLGGKAASRRKGRPRHMILSDQIIGHVMHHVENWGCTRMICIRASQCVEGLTILYRYQYWEAWFYFYYSALIFHIAGECAVVKRDLGRSSTICMKAVTGSGRYCIYILLLAVDHLGHIYTHHHPF